MNRLTSYESDCQREMICRYEDCDTCEEYCPHLNEDNCLCLQEVLEKLAKYENMHERLIKRIEEIKATSYYPHNFTGQMVEDLEWVLSQLN